MICAGAIVNTGSVIGRERDLNTGATVDHHAIVGDYVHIAPGVHWAARSRRRGRARRHRRRRAAAGDASAPGARSAPAPSSPATCRPGPPSSACRPDGPARLASAGSAQSGRSPARSTALQRTVQSHETNLSSRRPTSAPPSARCCSTRSTRTGSRRSARTSTRSSASSPTRSACRTRSRCRAAPRRCTSRCTSSASARGDEVLTSTLTFAATANAITYVGATPVFVDVSPETWNLDPDLLEEELRRRGRARHAGRPRCSPSTSTASAPTTPASPRSARATACRSSRTPPRRSARPTARGSAGAFGECAAFSFNGNKIITTSGGGMLVSHRRDIVERARHLATQARDPAPHYEHSEIGYNYRLSNLLAAVGRGQLAIAAAQGRAATRDQRDLPRGAGGPARRRRSCRRRPTAARNCWLTCVTIDPARVRRRSREDIRLAPRGARTSRRGRSGSRCTCSRSSAAAESRGGAVAEDLFERGLCLPSGSSLTAGSSRHRVIASTQSRAAPRRALNAGRGRAFVTGS